VEPLGTKIRRKRKELGLTLDELAGRTRVSKPYLSLIETGRVTNPPSDEKLRRLEHALGFAPSELVGQAHLQRTPSDVRAILARLISRSEAARGEAAAGEAVATGLDLDAAYTNGVLQELADRRSGNLEPVRGNTVPIINKLSAGYPEDFTDLGYPPRHADSYIGCPDLDDPDAFAARVHGDSMAPKYREGDVVIFSPAALPRSGDDCFVRFEDGHTTFKRAFFEEDESGRGVIRLQPRNEKYRPQVVPAEQVSGLYRAVYRYERVDE
jgi:phage repressor protein C with HTH and peptisase S24 domain